MKRFMLVLIAVLLLLALSSSALALTRQEALDTSKSMVTEVYGYRPEDAAQFEFTLTDENTHWLVTYYPKAHPNWLFYEEVSKEYDQSLKTVTPFDNDYRYYPGLGSVMYVLNAAKDGGWFLKWDAAAMDAMQASINNTQIKVNRELQTGLGTHTITAAQAVQAFFESCFGDSFGWSQALEEFRDEVLAQYSLEPEGAFKPIVEQGVTSYTIQGERLGVEITHFVGETPDMLKAVLAHPALEGWTLLCGAVKDYKTDISLYQTSGLAAFEKDGQRLLAALWKEGESWKIAPVGAKALLPDRELHIIADPMTGFVLDYPISETEGEQFTVIARLRQLENAPGYHALCRMISYRCYNETTGDGVTISIEPFETINSDYGWYHVTTYTPGQPRREETFEKALPLYLDYIDAQTFPKTAEDCAKATGYTLPDNYAITAGVHLRQKTSSRSTDLGMYNPGAIVEVLDMQPGDPHEWAHVRIGDMEGYMSSVYLHDSGTDSIRKYMGYWPMSVAMTRKDVSLKEGTGWFDGTKTQLPAGTKMHVLASIGSWLHVMIPSEGQPGWLMDMNGTDGYVKADDVVMAATSVQLDWLK